LKKQTKPITVVWEDAITLPGMKMKDVDTRKPELVRTYGVLVRKNKDYHVVMTHNACSDEGEDNGDNDYVRIPSGIVREVLE
jgi:hypothetical protein